MISFSEFREIAQPNYKMQRDSSLTHYYRRISIYWSYLLVHTGITANGVTILSIVAGVSGSLLLATPQPVALIASALLMHLYYILDCSDGEVARYLYHNDESALRNFSGDYADHSGHLIIQPLTVYFLGAGLSEQYPILGLGGGIICILPALFAARPANSSFHSTVLANLSRTPELWTEPVFQSMLNKRIGLAENRLGSYAPRRAETFVSHFLLLPGAIFQVSALALIYTIASLAGEPRIATYVHAGMVAVIYVGLCGHFLRTSLRNYVVLKAHGFPRKISATPQAVAAKVDGGGS